MIFLGAVLSINKKTGHQGMPAFILPQKYEYFKTTFLLYKRKAEVCNYAQFSSRVFVKKTVTVEMPSETAPRALMQIQFA